MAIHLDEPIGLRPYDRGAHHRDVRHPDFAGGARLDAKNDDRDALQACLDDLGEGEVAYFPATPAACARVEGTLTLPARNSLGVHGAGFRSSRLRQARRGANLLDTASSWAGTMVNYQSFRDLWLDGAGLAPVCLHLRAQHRNDISCVVVEDAAEVGLLVEDCMMIGARRLFLYGNRDGMRVRVNAPPAGGSGLNGAHMELFAEGNRGIAVDLGNGTAGSYLWVLAQANGSGLRMGQDVISTVVDGYFEQNGGRGEGSYDVLVGEDSFCKSVEVRGYFNGSADPGYIPIRVGYAQDCVFRPRLNVGSLLFAFEPGKPFYRCVFAPTYIGGSGPVPTDPRTVYRGLPHWFADAGNRIEDPLLVPMLPGNFVEPGFPAGWAAYNGATTSWQAVGRWRGRHELRRLARVRENAQVQYTVPVGPRANAELRGRFVTLAVPAGSDGGVDSVPLRCSLIQEGVGYLTPTGPRATPLPAHALGAGEGVRERYVTAYVPADMNGNLIVDLTLPANATGVLLAQPALYVGAAPLPPWMV